SWLMFCAEALVLIVLRPGQSDSFWMAWSPMILRIAVSVLVNAITSPLPLKMVHIGPKVRWSDAGVIAIVPNPSRKGHAARHPVVLFQRSAWACGQGAWLRAMGADGDEPDSVRAGRGNADTELYAG